MKFLSALIVIIVFTTVIMSSFLILQQSFISDSSNLKLASAFMHKQFGIANADSLTDALKISCETLVSGEANNSVVDFLNANKIDSSFKARTVLAHEAGIKNYRGRYGDNGVLLNYLISKYSKQNNCPKVGG